MAEQSDFFHAGPFRRAALGRRSETARAKDLARWRAIASEDDLKSMLLRVLVDEELALRHRALVRLRAAAVLLDLERLTVAAAARVAYHTSEYEGSEPLEAWIETGIDRAIDDLLTEDAIGERDDRPVAPDDSRYVRLAEQLQVNARTTRRACVVFQRLPREERAAFWAAVIDGKTSEEHAAEAGVSVSVARERLERAASSFCSLGKRIERPDEGPADGEEAIEP